MRIQSTIPYDDELEDCISLQYQVEIGELHERDKISWIEDPRKSIIQSKMGNQSDDDEDIFFKKIKSQEFEFRMNHISQTIKIEVIANFKRKTDMQLNQKSIFCGFYGFSRCIRKSGQFNQPNQIGFALFEDIDI